MKDAEDEVEVAEARASLDDADDLVFDDVDPAPRRPGRRKVATERRLCGRKKKAVVKTHTRSSKKEESKKDSRSRKATSDSDDTYGMNSIAGYWDEEETVESADELKML